MTIGTPPRDVRERLSAGLAELLASSNPGSAQQRRNVLLDRSGSDYRPLVELLLRVGRHGIEQTLRQLGPVSATEWPAKRASLVARVTNDLFVPSELASWAVDSWAVAVGTLSPQDMQALHSRWRAEQAARSGGGATTGVAPSAQSGATGGRGGRRGVRPGQGAAAGVAAGAAPRTLATRANTTPPFSTGATRPLPRTGSGLRGRRAGAGASPIPLPSTGRVITIMAAAVAVLAAVVIRGAAGRETSPRAVGAPIDSAALVATTVGSERAAGDGVRNGELRDGELRDGDVRNSELRNGDVRNGDVRNGTVRRGDAFGDAVLNTDTPNDRMLIDARSRARNREVIRRTAIGSSAEDIGPMPRPVPTPTPLPATGALAADLDTVVMDDGGVLVGAIRLVAPNDLFVHDVNSGLEYALPRSRITRVVTRTGADLTLATRAVDTAELRPGATARAMLAAGVGGSYRVEQRVRSVVGNALCAPVADALERDVIHSVEEVLHQPGTREFELLTRPGVSGTLEATGRFVTAPFAGSRDGVRFVFRMSGQFSPGGFSARTVTETESIIRYRRTQACRIVADLLGTKTLGIAP